MAQPIPCPRCGAPRVIAKTWEEELETISGTSKLKHTLMVCEDADCQAKVDSEVAKQEQKRAAALLAKEQRMQRAMNHSHNRSSSAK